MIGAKNPVEISRKYASFHTKIMGLTLVSVTSTLGLKLEAHVPGCIFWQISKSTLDRYLWM